MGGGAVELRTGGRRKSVNEERRRNCPSALLARAMFGGCVAGQPSMQAAGLPACLIRSMLAPESRTSNARAPAGQAGRHTQHARRPGAPEALVGASPPLHAVVVCVCVVTGHTLRRGWCVRGVEWPHEYAPTINAKLQPRLTFSQTALTFLITPPCDGDNGCICATRGYRCREPSSRGPHCCICPPPTASAGRARSRARHWPRRTRDGLG